MKVVKFKVIYIFSFFQNSLSRDRPLLYVFQRSALRTVQGGVGEKELETIFLIRGVYLVEATR